LYPSVRIVDAPIEISNDRIGRIVKIISPERKSAALAKYHPIITFVVIG
jgi:hypothetical protein